jgi:hypothetical protein
MTSHYSDLLLFISKFHHTLLLLEISVKVSTEIQSGEDGGRANQSAIFAELKLVSKEMTTLQLYHCTCEEAAENRPLWGCFRGPFHRG